MKTQTSGFKLQTHYWMSWNATESLENIGQEKHKDLLSFPILLIYPS